MLWSLGSLVLLAGILLAAYPFISNYLMSLNHNSEIVSADNAVKKADNSELKEELEKAEKYNKSLLGNVVLTDPFDPTFQDENNVEYNSVLNLGGNSVMGSVEIPKINVKLPIYHGTGKDVLEKGAGHLRNTSLPIGGKSTHAVLTGHTGLSTAVLFTDLDKLEKGDVFYIYVLDKTLAYEVDQIKVVLPTQTEDLKVQPGEDHVTLLTCTPYGLNTHRLLVRGTRIPYEKAETIKKERGTAESTWMLEYKRGLILGAAAIVLIVAVFVTVRALISRRRKKKQRAAEADSQR